MANIWWLQCNGCDFRLHDKTAAKPICPECGKRLHIHVPDEQELRREKAKARVQGSMEAHGQKPRP